MFLLRWYTIVLIPHEARSRQEPCYSAGGSLRQQVQRVFLHIERTTMVDAPLCQRKMRGFECCHDHAIVPWTRRLQCAEPLDGWQTSLFRRVERTYRRSTAAVAIDRKVCSASVWGRSIRQTEIVCRRRRSCIRTCESYTSGCPVDRL